MSITMKFMLSHLAAIGFIYLFGVFVANNELFLSNTAWRKSIVFTFLTLVALFPITLFVFIWI